MHYLLSLLIFVPGFAIAAAPTDFRSLVDVFIDILSILVPFVFALTFIVLAWGIIKAWILSPGDAQGIENGKKLVVVGIIGLVVMSGIWGILALLRSGIFGV